MRDYNQLYDFSAVCIQASKAVELELSKRFYDKYIEYLLSKYNQLNSVSVRKNSPDFIEWLPRVLKKTRADGNYVNLDDHDITLGKILYIIGLNIYNKIKDSTAYESIVDYAKNELLSDTSTVRDTLLKHVGYISRINNSYRNKAAHKNPMNIVTAKECIDYIIELECTLGEMLNDYNF